MMNGATEGNALIAKASLLARLKEENKYMKNNNLELAKKINFGKAINRDLTKRLRKARKLQK